MRRRAVRQAAALALLAVALLLLPDSTHHPPARLSLVKVQTAQDIHFADDIVWVLALGSDARGSEDLMEGRADAIELIGLDFDAGAAIAIGILRDSWVQIPGAGSGRINTGLPIGGPQLMSSLVEELVGIQPDYVFTAGFDDFSRLVDSIGGVTVASKRAFVDPRYGFTVKIGLNRMDGENALGYARSRYSFPTQDVERVGNQQQLLRGILGRLISHQDVPGFIERGALTALASLNGLETDLSSDELYRFAQALTQLRLTQVTLCVLPGRFGTVGPASVVFPFEAVARRIGREARGDATLESGC